MGAAHCGTLNKKSAGRLAWGKQLCSRLSTDIGANSQIFCVNDGSNCEKMEAVAEMSGRNFSDVGGFAKGYFGGVGWGLRRVGGVGWVGEGGRGGVFPPG